MEYTIPHFVVSLGNCGTSTTTFLPTFDDCIVIKSNQSSNRVSLKFLKNDNRDVDVRLFSNPDSNEYDIKRNLSTTLNDCGDTTISLFCIVIYLMNNDLTYSYPKNINNSQIKIVIKGIENLVAEIKKFINSNPKLSHWGLIFEKFENYKKQIEQLKQTTALQAPGNVGGSHKRYRTSRKYRKQQSRKKSRRHFQRRKKTHRRKSRTSRRSRK
jgi:hypothetical protein